MATKVGWITTQQNKDKEIIGVIDWKIASSGRITNSRSFN